MSKQEDFRRSEKSLEKPREIDNEARISKKAEMKRKFNRNQKRITRHQLSSLTSLICSFLKNKTLAQVFFVNFAKFVKTYLLQNATKRLLLVIAVSIVLVMKGELASKTVNCDTKTKYQIEPQV